MNRKLLVQLADMTGGGFYVPSEIDRLADDISIDEVTVRETRTVSFWNHPAVLAVLVCLLTGEWLFRRYFGMV